MERKSTSMSEDKKVDEDWKRRVQQEKETLHAPEGQPRKAAPASSFAKAREDRPSAQKEEPAPPPAESSQASFMHFVATLAAQVMMSLGEVESPQGGAQEPDLDQAQYLIDVLRMLREKTQGNLAEQEKRSLDAILHDLQLQFVKASQT